MESIDSHDKAQMASESIKPLEQGNKIIRGASGLLNAIPFVKCTPEVFSICSDEVGACTTLLEDAQERRPAAPLDDNIPHSSFICNMIMSELLYLRRLTHFSKMMKQLPGVVIDESI